MSSSKSRQSAGRFLVGIFGSVIGAISTLFVYPYNMDLHGLSSFLLNTSMILSPIFLLGFNGVAVNNYQEFKTQDKTDHGFLGFLLLFFLTGCFIYVFVFLGFSDHISKFFNSNKSDYNSFFNFILPITVFSAGTVLMESYLSNFMKVVIPSFLRETLIKITLPVLILLVYFKCINIDQAMWGLVINYVFSFILLLLYAFYLRPSFKIDFSFLNKKRLRRILLYGILMSLGAIGSQLVGSLDIIMIKAILPPLELISVFNMHFTLASFVFMPYIAIMAIGGPLIATHIYENNHQQLGYLYRSSTSLMLVLGVLLFILKRYDFSPFWVFLFLGLARLIDLATGLNTAIITYSPHYKVMLYATLGLGVLNFIMNYFLIHRYNIQGAAISTLISITLFNIYKIWFVYRKYKILPFERRQWKILPLFIFCMMPMFLPLHFKPVLNILIRGILVLIIYSILAYKWHISHHLNHFVQKQLSRLGLLRMKQ